MPTPPLSVSKTFSPPQKKPVGMKHLVSILPSPASETTSVLPVWMDFLILAISCQWNPTSGAESQGPWRLASFLCHDVSEVHPHEVVTCISASSPLWLSHGPSPHTPRFVHMASLAVHLGCFCHLAVVNDVTMNTCVWVSVCLLFIAVLQVCRAACLHKTCFSKCTCMFLCLSP